MSKTLNLNNSANLKQNLEIFLVVYQGPRWSCSIYKKGGEKSRESVPLKGQAARALPRKSPGSNRCQNNSSWTTRVQFLSLVIGGKTLESFLASTTRAFPCKVSQYSSVSTR